MKRWYYAKGKDRHGPLEADELKSLATLGQVKPDDLVWREDMTEWKQAGSVKGLFPELRLSALPPLPATAVTEPVGTTTTPDSTETSPSPRSFGEKLRAVWRSFLGTAKAAKDLTAAQGRRAKLSKFDLPAAYLALGRSVFESGSFRGEFADFFDRIETTKTEIEKLGHPTSNQTDGTDFKNKVRAGAATLKAKGQQKALSVKLDSLYRELGQRTFEAHGESADSQAVVSPIIRCRGEIESLDREITRLSETSKGTLLTPKRLIIGGCVVGVLLFGMICSLLNNSPDGSSRSVSSGSSRSTSAEDLLSRTARLTTEMIVQRNSWETITPNRFHQMMEETARESGATEIVPIKFKTDGPHHDANSGVTTLTQSFGDSIWCGYRIDHGGPRSTIKLVRVEIDGEVYRPPNWRGR